MKAADQRPLIFLITYERFGEGRSETFNRTVTTANWKMAPKSRAGHWLSFLIFLMIGGCYPLNGVSMPQNLLCPSEDEIMGTLPFDAAYQSGITCLRVGQADEAVKLLTRAVRLEPRNKVARCTLGRAFIQAGEPAESVEQFRECAELD